MILKLKVHVPNSADTAEVYERLLRAAASRQGITLVMPDQYEVDVDLADVEQVPIHDGTKVVRHDG